MTFTIYSVYRYILAIAVTDWRENQSQGIFLLGKDQHVNGSYIWDKKT